MKRIVWLFGDGSTQYTHVDPTTRLLGETEDEQIERFKRVTKLEIYVPRRKYDNSVRTPEEMAAYVAALGDGAKQQFAGIISEDEYMDKFNRLREFRDGWTWITPEPVIDFDMPKCREIHRRRLRVMRKPKLEALDVDYLHAEERDDLAEKQRIAALKQKLRDVTKDPVIESARTPEELKATMSELLR